MPDDVVQSEACWAIAYLTAGSNDRIQAVIEADIPHSCAGCGTRIVQLLRCICDRGAGKAGHSGNRNVASLKLARHSAAANEKCTVYACSRNRRPPAQR